MDYQGGSNVTTRVFINGRERQKRGRKGDVAVDTASVRSDVAGYWMEEGRNPRNMAGSRTWKRQGSRVSTKSSREE